MFKLSEIKKLFDSKAKFVNWQDDVVSKTVVRHVEHDTRRIEAGSIYIAIKGKHFDGHDFVGDGASHGAVACIVEKEIGGVSIPQIIVDDSTLAYGELAVFWRNKITYPIIALTGSNGKTTTKDMLYNILSKSKKNKRIVKNPGNFNNLIGLPYSLLGFPLDADYGILEMGMNARGEIARMSEIARPHIGVITNIARAHIGYLGSIEEIFHAKMELFDYLAKSEGVFVVNLSDPLISRWFEELNTGQKVITFSSNNSIKADLVIEGINGRDGEQEFKITLSDGEAAKGRIKILGQYNLPNIAAAVAISTYLGISLDEGIKSLESFSPPSMRSNLIVRDGVKYFLDCYNANPDSMNFAIETGAQLKGVKRRIAVIGDMLELEDMAVELHREVGRTLAEHSYDFVFAIGEYALDYARGFTNNSSKKNNVFIYNNNAVEDLKRDMKKVLSKGDLVLIKASRAAKLESVLEVY